VLTDAGTRSWDAKSPRSCPLEVAATAAASAGSYLSRRGCFRYEPPGYQPEALAEFLSKFDASCMNAPKEFPIGFRATDYPSSGSSFFNFSARANARARKSSGVNARSSSSNDIVPVYDHPTRLESKRHLWRLRPPGKRRCRSKRLSLGQRLNPTETLSGRRVSQAGERIAEFPMSFLSDR
jgi:hypothetical protein